MLEAKAAYEKAGHKFSAHAVAVTGLDSELDKVAVNDRWLERFPMWDWVGGRTSETSAVGLLPAALQGIDIDQFLAGAKACDEVTRKSSLRENPSAQLALAWLHATGGKGAKDMVILPYKDRLELFSKYLQQLTMESLGKAKDNDGKVVNQGIAVYGNKGSTDQHAYIQQLRDGVNNFFATFIQVVQDRAGASMQVEPNVTSGDYLLGFYLGTRQALYENSRESITLTIKDVSPFSIGVLIALYERAVGFYATLVNINAYHQPGVEAGKKAATAVLKLQTEAFDALRRENGREISLKDLAAELKAGDQIETLLKICDHLAANNRGIRKIPSSSPFDPHYLAG
jgi:glucose-6-phosphate isomerase